MDKESKPRGKRATFDRKTGEAHGGAPGENHDDDRAAGGAADPVGAFRPLGVPA